jgi:hypothetical protein
MLVSMRMLLSLWYLIALTNAQEAPVICAWAQGRAGTVRDTLYLDGGVTVNNTWSPSGWTNQNPKTREPPAYLYKFNYSTPFSYQETPPDLDALLGQQPLTVDGARYNAKLYRGGSMLTDDFEIYTYGQVSLHVSKLCMLD